MTLRASVDDPYLSRICIKVDKRWFNLIPISIAARCKTIFSNRIRFVEISASMLDFTSAPHRIITRRMQLETSPLNRFIAISIHNSSSWMALPRQHRRKKNLEKLTRFLWVIIRRYPRISAEHPLRAGPLRAQLIIYISTVSASKSTYDGSI